MVKKTRDDVDHLTRRKFSQIEICNQINKITCEICGINSAKVLLNKKYICLSCKFLKEKEEEKNARG